MISLITITLCVTTVLIVATCHQVKRKPDKSTTTNCAPNTDANNSNGAVQGGMATADYEGGYSYPYMSSVAFVDTVRPNEAYWKNNIHPTSNETDAHVRRPNNEEDIYSYII